MSELEINHQMLQDWKYMEETLTELKLAKNETIIVGFDIFYQKFIEKLDRKHSRLEQHYQGPGLKVTCMVHSP